MNVALRTPVTLEAFLAWEECQGLRYEFDGVQPVAMTGGTAAQTSPAAMVFHHKGEDWVSETLIGPEAVLLLPDLAREIPLAELYADIDVTQ